MSTRVEYFEDWNSGDLFACVGPSARSGLFRLRNPSPHARWEWLEVASVEWDAAHQKIYRAHRVDSVDPGALGWPLPSVPFITTECRETGGGTDYRRAARDSKTVGPTDDFPALRELLSRCEGSGERAESGEPQIFLLLGEDRYETQFGDGEFHDFATASFSRARAAAYPVGHGSKWSRFHLLTGTIRLEAGEFALSFEPSSHYDHWRASAVVRALDEEASAHAGPAEEGLS